MDKFKWMFTVYGIRLHETKTSAGLLLLVRTRNKQTNERKDHKSGQFRKKWWSNVFLFFNLPWETNNEDDLNDTQNHQDELKDDSSDSLIPVIVSSVERGGSKVNQKTYIDGPGKKALIQTTKKDKKDRTEARRNRINNKEKNWKSIKEYEIFTRNKLSEQEQEQRERSR